MGLSDYAFYLIQYRLVCRQPLYASQMLTIKPCSGLMLKQRQRARYHAAQIAAHAEVEGRVVPLPTVVTYLSTLISVASSSRISRTSAFSDDSPASSLPPGSSHHPRQSPYPRCVAKILPSWTIRAATTLMVFIFPQGPEI